MYTDKQLLYSTTARCKCGAGLAYPLNHKEALKLRAWVCSEWLKHSDTLNPKEHESFPFAVYKIREETSINNRGGFTTRPVGTKALTKPEFTCKKCGTWWEGEAYSACALNHHAFSDCPTCGAKYLNPDGSSSMDVEGRYHDVVVNYP